MTRSPSTTSRAGSVMLSPAAPSSLSMVTTSSRATFSCLPPQRTIAYTRELSFVALSLRAPARRWSPRRLACTSGPAQRTTPDRQDYQTAAHPRTRTVRGLPPPGSRQAAPSCACAGSATAAAAGAGRLGAPAGCLGLPRLAVRLLAVRLLAVVFLAVGLPRVRWRAV